MVCAARAGATRSRRGISDTWHQGGHNPQTEHCRSRDSGLSMGERVWMQDQIADLSSNRTMRVERQF